MANSLDKLLVENFRCLERAELQPSAGINLICGGNATGKTSLLEAVFVLGRGRSFRTAQRARLVRDGATAFQVTGEVNRAGGRGRMGIRAGRSEREIRIDGRPAASVAELGDYLPVEAIDPDVHKLVEAGPERRRRYLDWGTFHVDQSFLGTWQRYRRALRQRNALLQARAFGQANAWEEELAGSGEALTAMRQTFLAALAGPLAELGETLLGSPIAVEFRQGWRQSARLLATLAENRERDAGMGRTLAGPHRAELLVELGNTRARARVSRGQQKLLAACLILAQLRVITERGRPRGILLVDDPGAELDRSRVTALLGVLKQLDTQIFLTALDRDALPEIADRVFHMEHGRARLMV